jgi:hypothetical protein
VSEVKNARREIKIYVGKMGEDGIVWRRKRKV